MNKTELVAAIAEKSGLEKNKATAALDALIAVVTKELASSNTVTLVGFGSFSVAKRAARIGRNPKTGGEIKIAATTTPKFKPGKTLKDVVAGKTKEPAKVVATAKTKAK